MNTSSIAKRIQIIEDLKTEKQSVKDMLDDSLINDDEYRKLKPQLESIQGDLKAKKTEIIARSENEKLISKFKEINQELKEERETLTAELIEFYRQTQGTEIESLDGTRLKLKFSAKLIPLNNYHG